jgi:hypothetical protein
MAQINQTRIEASETCDNFLPNPPCVSCDNRKDSHVQVLTRRFFLSLKSPD